MSTKPIKQDKAAIALSKVNQKISVLLRTGKIQHNDYIQLITLVTNAVIEAKQVAYDKGFQFARRDQNDPKIGVDKQGTLGLE